MVHHSPGIVIVRKRSLLILEYDLVYCTDPKGLVEKSGICYNHEDWRIFIDSSERSLKNVLLHNSNNYALIPVGYSVIMKESYENLVVLLDRINYKNHNWMICGDMKIVCMLLGQQSKESAVDSGTLA